MKCKYPGYDWCFYFRYDGTCGVSAINTSACPGYADEAEQADAHSCKACADAYGFCQVCGAAVYGTMAYRDLYGGE